MDLQQAAIFIQRVHIRARNGPDTVDVIVGILRTELPLRFIVERTE